MRRDFTYLSRLTGWLAGHTAHDPVHSATSCSNVSVALTSSGCCLLSPTTIDPEIAIHERPLPTEAVWKRFSS